MIAQTAFYFNPLNRHPMKCQVVMQFGFLYTSVLCPALLFHRLHSPKSTRAWNGRGWSLPAGRPALRRAG